MQCDLFIHFIAISNHRNMSKYEVLSYTLGPIAWSLPNSTGTMSRMAKSQLMNLMETDKYEVDGIPEGASWILDGGVWLHKL